MQICFLRPHERLVQMTAFVIVSVIRESVLDGQKQLCRPRREPSLGE